MARTTTWGEALELLRKHGFMEVMDINLDIKDGDMHKILHKYRETIIVPYVAISDNLHFLMEYQHGKKPFCLTADGCKCQADNIEEKSIFELENDISELYKLTAWNFLKKWDNAKVEMNSLTFVKMNLKKVE